jgi:hypothetical protein
LNVDYFRSSSRAPRRSDPAPLSISAPQKLDSLAVWTRTKPGFDKASANGNAAIKVDGTMVDFPVVQGARWLLAEYEAIQQRARSRAAD